MKRLLSCILIAASALFIFSGCSKGNEAATTYDVGKVAGEASGSEESQTGDESGEDVTVDADKPVDVKALASELLKQIDYSDELSELDLETAKMFLNIGDIDIEECCIYESSGATAEEIAVLRCKDSDNAARAKEAFNERISEQIENFTDYVPEEVPKLKDAVIITSKEYAVLSVSSDSGKAKSIIEGAFTK